MSSSRIRIKCHLLFVLFLSTTFTNEIHSQSICDPKSIVGFWRSKPSFYDQLLGFDRIWAFSNDGRVQIYTLNSKTKRHELNGEAEYHLDNMFQPRKVIVTNSNFGDVFNGGASFEFQLVTLSENYYEWIPMVGIGSIRYDRVNDYSDPSFVGGAFRGISTRPELLDELLKSPIKTEEEVYAYLKNNSIAQLSDAFEQEVDILGMREALEEIYYVASGRKILKTIVVDVVLSKIQNLFTKVYYERIYDRLQGFDEELCLKINELKQAKLEHDEVYDEVMIFQPEVFASQTFQASWNKEFYENLDETTRIHRLRRRLNIEMGIISAFKLN